MCNDPDKTDTVKICFDCLSWTANDETNPDWNEYERAEFLTAYYKGLNGGNYELTLGIFNHLHECHDHHCELDEWGHPVDDDCDCPRADDCECENYGFSHSWCDICNQPLAGDRTLATIWW